MALTRLLSLCLILLIGCSKQVKDAVPNQSTSPALEFTDDTGRAIQLTTLPERIIPLAPNLTEILFEIGAQQHIAAVSLSDDFPPEVGDLPKFSSFPMDFEALVGFKPELLIATDVISNPKDAGQFTSLGLPIAYYSFKSWEDIPRAMRSLGILVDNEAFASQRANAFESRINALTEKTAGLAPLKSLFLIGADQLYAFGKDNYIHEAIALAGGKSVTADIEAVSPILTEEFVLTAQPEVILGTFRDKDQLLTHHPAFRNVPAIVNNRVCTIDASLLLRPGPRLPEGIEQMAACIHPFSFKADR